MANNHLVSNNDPIWIKDISILLDSDRLTEFIPNRGMSYNRKSNALIRFATYIGVVLAVFNQDYLYLELSFFHLLLFCVHVYTECMILQFHCGPAQLMLIQPYLEYLQHLVVVMTRIPV